MRASFDFAERRTDFLEPFCIHWCQVSGRAQRFEFVAFGFEFPLSHYVCVHVVHICMSSIAMPNQSPDRMRVGAFSSAFAGVCRLVAHRSAHALAGLISSHASPQTSQHGIGENVAVMWHTFPSIFVLTLIWLVDDDPTHSQVLRQLTIR